MKSNILKIVIALIFLILFNVLFFVLGGTERTTNEWICYAFIHVAYICLLATPVLCRKEEGEGVLSATLYMQAITYFFAELVVGLGLMWYCIQNGIESPTWPAIIQSVMLAVFLVMQLMQTTANEATHESLAKQRQERIYIRSLAENLRDAMHQVKDPAIKKQMANCYESLNNSSLESFPVAMDAEIELENAVNALCAGVEQGNDNLTALIEKVQTGIRHRNQAIRMARSQYPK